MVLTRDERNDVAALCHDMAQLASEAAQAARNEDAPLLPVARLIADAQDKGSEVVRRLIGDILD